METPNNGRHTGTNRNVYNGCGYFLYCPVFQATLTRRNAANDQARTRARYRVNAGHHQQARRAGTEQEQGYEAGHDLDVACRRTRALRIRGT